MVSDISMNSELEDATLVVRQILASGTTDPITGSRSSDSKFILTSYPDRPVEYPIITVVGTFSAYDSEEGRKLGSNTEAMNMPMDFEVKIWSRNMKEVDALASQVIHTLRTSQQTASGTEAFGLYNLEIGKTVRPVDEEGKEGIHSIAIPVSYDFTMVRDGNFRLDDSLLDGPDVLG